MFRQSDLAALLAMIRVTKSTVAVNGVFSPIRPTRVARGVQGGLPFRGSAEETENRQNCKKKGEYGKNRDECSGYHASQGHGKTKMNWYNKEVHPIMLASTGWPETRPLSTNNRG